MTPTFTIDDVRALSEKFGVTLKHYCYGFFSEGVLSHTSCLLGFVLLHHTQSLEDAADFLERSLRAGYDEVDEFVADQVGWSRNYVMGLETGYECFGTISGHNHDDPDYLAGIEQGRAIRVASRNISS